MVKKGYTEIVCIIDKSTSMAHTMDEVRSGFEEFIKEQKEQPGNARLTVTTFNHNYDILLDGAPLSEVPNGFLTEKNYNASGCTALLDAVGRTIDSVGERLSDMDESERPEKVIFLIMTDGQENSSQEYVSAVRIAEMVKHQTEKYNWEFMFIGANIDAFAQAHNFGIKIDNAALYNQGRQGGTVDTFKRLTKSVSNYRSCGATRGIDSEDSSGTVTASADKHKLIKGDKSS